MTDSPSKDKRCLVVRLLGEPYADGQDLWRFVPGNEVHIGRSSKNEIQLPENRISRVHAILRYDQSNWVCTSVGRTGVLYRRRPISEITLTDGTVLQLGVSGPRFHFQLLADTNRELNLSDDQSVIEWIDRLAKGDTDATTTLWEEYFERVVRLAKSRISARQRRITDEEDVAVSVFESLCVGMEAGRFPDLTSHDSLWRLLCVMTKRKVARHAQHERREKRGGGRVRGESVFVGAADSNALGFDRIGATDRGNLALQLADQAEWLFQVLGDDELRRITELKLADHTNEEIAEKLGCHVRTVKRRLHTIRSILAAALPDEESD